MYRLTKVLFRNLKHHLAQHPIAVINLLLFLTTAALGQAQTYQFPFIGEDLNPGERFYTGDHAGGIQAEGEDLGALRYLGNGQWDKYLDGTNGSNNSDFVVYDKQVYAISDGIIVGCWRNAPENPNPPAKHTKFIDGFIPGGGNMLFVDQPDGNRVLYAHMIPGTIPSALCPNDDEYFPYSMSIPQGDAFLMLDEADQIPIHKGDPLGRAGNSGSSSGPHLHLHAEMGGAPAIMLFEKGLYKDYQANNTDIQGGWASFAGQEVPDGEVLIRPPRSVPYRMVDFESYESNGKQNYAGIFEPDSYGPMALFKSDWSSFLSGWQAIEQMGYRMKDFEAYKQGNGLTYAGIFEPGDYAPMALFRNNWNDFLNGWQAIEMMGYRMKDLEVYEEGMGLTYAGIFEPGNYAPMALFQDTWSDFFAGWQAIEARGYRMKDFEAYHDGSKLKYAGIFEPGSFAPMALFKNDWNGFVSDWKAIEELGYRMKDLEIYDNGRDLTFAGIFEPGTHQPAALFLNDWDAFLEGWQNLE